MSGVLLFAHPVSAGTWSCPATTGDKPPPCYRFTLTKLDDSRVVMFGGGTGSGHINDVYMLDVRQWVCYYVMDINNSGGVSAKWSEHMSKQCVATMVVDGTPGTVLSYCFCNTVPWGNVFPGSNSLRYRTIHMI